MRLVLIGTRKYWTRIATIVSLLVAISLVMLEMIAIGITVTTSPEGIGGISPAQWRAALSFPGVYETAIVYTIALGGLVALIYVAAVSGSEWTWGTLKVAATRGESRSRYIVATFASISIVLLVGMLVTFVFGVLGGVLGASIGGINPGNPITLEDAGATLVKLVRCWIALMSLAAVGYSVTMIAKSQMAGIGMIIGFYVSSIFIPALNLPDPIREIFKYLPFSISTDSIGLTGPLVSGAGNSTGIDPTVALVVTIGWLVGCLAIACVATERTEIGG
jgi:ABC-type transport system involved in multi-copper enzyme maturation permease subunit